MGRKREEEREKLCKIINYAKLCNKKAKRQQPIKIGQELGVKGMGSKKFGPPAPLPPSPHTPYVGQPEKMVCVPPKYRRRSRAQERKKYCYPFYATETTSLQW